MTALAPSILVAGCAALSTTLLEPRLAPCGSDWRLEGGQALAHLGSSMTTADVNGDGFADLVVGAPDFDHDHLDEGRVSVFLGSSGGLAPVPDWEQRGRQRGAHFGASVARAGDVNGDGFDDIVIGAPGFDVRADGRSPALGDLGPNVYSSDEGCVLLYLGSAVGLTGPHRRVSGIERGERFGSAVTGVGDVNGDGFDDVLVGATGKAGGRGAIFLFAGTPQGMLAAPIWMQIGAAAGSGWGRVIGAAGDSNGDGFDDFVAGLPDSSSCAQMVCFFGGVAGPGAGQTKLQTLAALGPAGDFDRNGSVEQLLVYQSCPQLSSTGGAAWFVLSGSSSYGIGIPTLGDVAAITAGDLNGDGRAEIVVGSPDFEVGASHGRVFVYPGPALGSQTYSPTTAFPVFDGEQPGAGYGSVLAVGDVDGDGRDELFIAAPRQDATRAGEGVVTMIHGWHDEATLTPVAPAGTVGGPVADFNGDGYSDMISDRLLSNEPEQLFVRYGGPGGLSATADVDLVLPSLAAHEELDVSSSCGDVDGDGFDDVLAAFRAQTEHSIVDARLALYLGSSAGLGGPPAIALGSLLDPIAGFIVGDVNGDGFHDVWIFRPTVYEVHRGTPGLPTLSQTLPRSYLNSTTSVFHGDVDGDPFSDVVTLDLVWPSGQFVSVYRGSASGSFLQQTTQLAGVPPGYRCTALADLTGDGLDDLLLEGPDAPLVFEGGAAGFTGPIEAWWIAAAPSVSSSPARPYVLSLADVDGDGLKDIILGNLGSRWLRLHRGSPGGFLRVPSWAGIPLLLGQPVVEGASDFDGDGRIELLHTSDPFQAFEVSFP